VLLLVVSGLSTLKVHDFTPPLDSTQAHVGTTVSVDVIFDCVQSASAALAADIQAPHLFVNIWPRVQRQRDRTLTMVRVSRPPRFATYQEAFLLLGHA
jgi:hypothetical protein